MSIQVSEFRHIPGKNDAEYIKLLKEALERQKQITSKAIAKIKELSNYSESPNNWIPCTPETMPKDEYVLISKKPSKLSGSKWCVTIGIRTADPRSGKIYWRDIGFGVIQDDKVLAWMPLPEPYKEGNDEVN